MAGNSTAKISFWGEPSGSIPNPSNDQDPNSYFENGVVDPAWEDFNLSPWDYATIGDLITPGICRLDIKKEMSRQKKKAQGTNYASVSLLGFDNAEVIMTLKLWTRNQFEIFQELMRNLQNQLLQAITPNQVIADPTGALGVIITGSGAAAQAASAVRVQHPALQIYGITDLYVRQFVPPYPSGTPGVFEAKILFEEFRMPVKGTSSTITSSKIAYPKSAFDKDPSTSAKPTPPEQSGGALP